MLQCCRSHESSLRQWPWPFGVRPRLLHIYLRAHGRYLPWPRRGEGLCRPSETAGGREEGPSGAPVGVFRRAGLQGGPLDSRRTHATMLLRQGVHPKVVQERLGHASIGITLDTYSHVLPSMQEAAAERIDVGLRRAMEG